MQRRPIPASPDRQVELSEGSMLSGTPQIDRVEVGPFPCYMYVRPWEVVLRVSGVINAQEQAFVADLLGGVKVHRADECRQVRIVVVKTTPVHVRQVDVGFVPFSGEGYRLRYQVVAPYPAPQEDFLGCVWKCRC